MRRKLNAMPAVFEGKKVLLVDDSIVRGTTMSQIVEMVRKAGAVKVRLPARCQPGHRSAVLPGITQQCQSAGAGAHLPDLSLYTPHGSSCAA